MEAHDLKSFTKGWFVGRFFPTLFDTDQFEVAVKRYNAGDCESTHLHKIATEYTLVVSGMVRMNGVEYKSDNIVVVHPNESTDFEALEDAVTVVVKVPCVAGDKYVLNEEGNA